MKFSELKFASEETKLSFDNERLMLYGEKNGYGVTVADRDGTYTVTVFAKEPYKLENEIIKSVALLGESLPKNTIMSQTCEFGYIAVVLDKYPLLQENIVYLIDFLEKLTSEVNKLGIAPDSYRLPRKETAVTATENRNTRKIKLGFSKESIVGFVGALVGAAAITIIAIMLGKINMNTEEYSLNSEITAYAVSLISAIVVFFDYRFLARKLDAFGIITCPVLIIASVFVSAFGIGIKTMAENEKITIGKALAEFSDYIVENEAISQFIVGYLTRSAVIVVIACILICIFYFRKHPEEMYGKEKIVSEADEKPKK